MNSTTNLPRISIVIPNYNGSEFLVNCLNSLQAQTLQPMEIIVVDNASSDQSTELIRTIMPNALLIRSDRNLGFAGAINLGIRSARGIWVAVLNNDTDLPPDWLAECARGIQTHPDAAFFACKIFEFKDRNRLFSAGDCYLRAGVGYRRGQELEDQPEFQEERRIFSASGCAALYRRDILVEAGGFDARFFAYLEDVDLGLRLQTKGHCGLFLPRAKVFHIGAGTSGGEFSPLAVRLRTRNALLLLLKNMPGRFLIQCLPMIMFMQFSWLARVIAHGRLGSYVRGLGGALLLFPAMLRERTRVRSLWKKSSRRLWQEIVQSEALARMDFSSGLPGARSRFLNLYFRLF